MAGREVGAPIELVTGNGGSCDTSNGGGGSPSFRSGELELLLGIWLEREGENMPRARLLVHPLGVTPLPIPKGVRPVGGGGSAQACILYDGSPCDVAFAALTIEDRGLSWSAGTVLGGVKRLPPLI